jgi:hypothetical protein
MSLSFTKFIEEDSKLLNLIRSGNNLRKNECGNFWDDFINLCGDSSAMSEMLEIPKEKITKWGEKINKLRQTVKEKDSNKKNRLLK